jgi:hypothetical protein
MRKLLALLLLLPSPALAQVATDQAQNNDNVSSAASQANQQNQSRSESFGGNLNNYQINQSMGDLGDMAIGAKGISCQSPTLFANAGVVPTDFYGFYTFDNRERQMMYAPQAQFGVQLPFGPQVSSCVEAMKNQALQTKIATESGILKKCLTTKVDATKAAIPLETVQASFPVLGKHCGKLWGLVN